MTKHNKQKKRSYQYSHAFADLPLTYQKALKGAIMDMVVSANSELQAHRQISPYSAVIAASRSLQTSSSSAKPAARVFAAIRAVNSFINLSRTGKPGVERLSNTDLLPVAHPLSTRSHTMNEASLRAARAQWLAADPRIDDNLRNLVAAAYSQAPGSVEHRHAFTRISVLPVGAIPRDIRIDADLQLTPIIAVLGLGGNSDAARSLRAQLQRRDRKGRFAEMGGGWSFKLRLPDGLFKTVSGRVVGASGTDAIEIEVTGSKDLDDGVYTMPSAKGESVKAVLPTKAVEELPDRDDAMDDVYVDSATLARKDAPSGWKQLGKTQQKGRTFYSEYTSDDGYTVKREARPNSAGTGVDYGYSVRRMEATDTDPFAKDKKVMRSWSEVQKAVLADQDDYKRDLEALSTPAGEPPSDAAPSSTEAVDISNILDKYKKMPKTSFEEKTKAAAYLTEEFTKLQRKNNRARFMYKGKERDVEITYAGVYASKYARAEGNAKLVGFDRNADGERSFFYNEIEPLTGEPPANSVDKHELRQRGDSNVYDYGDGIIINSPEAGVRVESKYNTPIYSIDSPLPPLNSIEDAKRAIEDWEANRTDRTNERMSDAIGVMIKNNRDAKKAGKTGAQDWKSDVARFVANFVAPIDSKKYKDEFGELKERLDSGELSWADGLVEAEQIVLRLREKGSVPKRTPQEWAEWAKRRHFPGDIEGNQLIDEAAAKAAAASEPPAGEPDDYGKSQEIVSKLTEALEEKGVDVDSLTDDVLDYLNDQASQIENGETSVEDAVNAFVDRWGDELDLPTAAPGEPDGPGADDDEVDDFDPYRFIERRLKLLKAVGDHNQGALDDDEFKELFDEIMDETGSLAPFSTSERMELLRLRDEYEDEMERVQATKDEDYDDEVDGKEEAINEVANNFYSAVADIANREKPLDGGPGEPPTGGPGEPGEPPFTSPEAARDILDEGALTAEGILTDIDDADLDDLDDDDANILEKINKLSDSARDALDNIDPEGSQLNDIYFDQARADLGEMAELLSNATNADMQDAGFVLKEAVDEYLSLPTIDFSGRRAELKVAAEPSALDGVVSEVKALFDSYNSGAVDASEVLDLLGVAIDDVPNNDQIYNSLKKQIENVELRGFSIEKAKSNAEKSIKKLASEEGAVPYLTAEKAPSTPETNDPVDQSLFDETFITSDDSYKLNVFEQYNPRGRVDQDSADYTDDPQILANSFTAENLQKALRQALVPSSDGDVAIGLGYLPFDGGDEAVPAEALYESLDFAGIDSDIVVAGIYDSALPEGSETNVERITMQRDDLDKIGGEDFNPADINTARDWEIKQAIKRNGELATPQRAALAVAQMTDAAKNEEKNPSIKEVADDLINRQNDPNLNEYSAENLGNVLDSYMPWSFSDSADEREAFRGFWGMLMSIDGGSTNDMDDKRPVQSTSGFRRAVYESVKRQSGGDEEVALAEYDRLISEYGGYPEWTTGKEAISDGDADIFSDQSSAGAFFRLMAASAKKNDVRLHRYIDVRKDDPALQQYLTPGVVLPIDARSFTTRDEAAEDIVSLLKYPPKSETTHIVFEIQPNEGTSISFASVSWFSGEAEHIAWGNYEVDSTRRVEMGGRTDLTVVSLRQVSASGVDADGGAADSDIFGPGDDAAVDTPAKPNVASWGKVGPQLGSNLGGTYEDPDGDIYYVKESKSLKHAENEALASAFYKELGVNAVDVRVGEADGAPRTVSPIVSTTGETLADRLNDGEFIDKIREDFAIDAWLGNYDVAGLVYDNIVVDNDGNPLRVDPGGALLFRARGAEKGDMFGDSVGEIDTLTDPDINPSASRVFGGMTEEQRKASAQKLLDITPQRIDQIVDSIVTDPGMAEGLKDRLKKRRADVLNRFDIEDSVLNMPEVAQRPTAPTDKSPEAIEAFKDELARFAMDKAIAKGWNCEGGLTSAATNPCDLPSVNELIAEATPTDAELAEPKVRQLPSDEEVSNAFDVIFDDIETYLSSDWGLDGNDKSKYKKTRTKIEDIRERYDAGEITREEAAAELGALRDEISASGGEPIAKEATAEGIDQIIKNLDGTIYDPVVVIDKDLPPPGSGLGLSKDKVTLVKPGMTVKSKDGVTYVVHRYDPSNWNYVYVKPTDGSKEKIKSTKTLEIVGGEGGGGGTPTAPEPSGPELPKAEAPKGAPKAPEVPFPDDMPLAPRAPEPPKSKKDKQQGVVGPGAAPVIIEDALPYTESGIAGTPSLADAFAYAASDAPNAAIVGSYAAIDSTDIEDMSVRVTRLQLFEKPEQITRMKFKLTAWAGEKLFKDIEDLKRNEYTTTQGVALEHISRKDTVVPAIKTDMKVYNNWRHGTTYEAALPNGVKIQFLRGAQGSYTDHVFSRSVEDYDEVVNALNNYVIVDIPDGVDLNEVRSALNVAGVVDPRPSVEQDFRVLIENRLISVLGGKTNASRNEARPEVRQEILSEVKTKYGIGVEDVYVGVGANGRIEMRVSKEKAAALAKEAKIEIAEHNLTVSAGYRPDPELAAKKIADIIVGPNRALMSTLARWTEGVSSSGQSSETDMATGGADYVFFSPKDMTVTSSIGYGVSDANDATVTFDAVDLFTRLDFYANYVDTYGARSEENDNLKNAAPGGYELMFKDRVSTDMLKDIVVHTRVVPFLIEELKNRGITEINGRSVDEVVTVGGQGVVMEKEGAIKKFQTKLDENLKTRFGEDFGGAKKYKDWLNEDPSGRAKEYAPPVDENAVIVAVKDLNNEKQERVIVRLTNGAYLSYTRYTGAIGAPFTYEYQEIENDFPGWTYLTSDEQSKGSN